MRGELDAAWLSYDTARSLLTRIEGEMLDKARSVLASMEYSYQVGEASLVELLDAQRPSTTRCRAITRRARSMRAAFTLSIRSPARMPGNGPDLGRVKIISVFSYVYGSAIGLRQRRQ